MKNIEQFREFECDENLFAITIDGVRIWEQVRFEIFHEIKQQAGSGQAHTSIDADTQSNQLKGAKLWFRNLFSRNPFLAPQSDIIFFGHQRRKKESDGYWWDIYCDPIHENCSLNATHFEQPYLLSHRAPAKTESLRYLEFLEYSGTILRKLGVGKIRFTPKETTVLSHIEDEIVRRFGVNTNLTEKVQEKLRNRRCRRWLYECLLERIDPNIAVIVVSYGKELFIEACKRKEIPVVELQHGIINSHHMGYSFTGNCTKELFPDYLLTWGDFWSKGIEFPIPDNRVIPVGYPYLEQTKQRYKNIKQKDQILFISQGIIGAELSQFALQVNQHPNINYNVVYKLHPGEYDRWESEYPWLADTEVTVIDSSEPPLYELFAESNFQVGVGSTAIYEGLSFGLETYIFDCEGSTVLQPLVDQGSAELISTSNELADSLSSSESKFNEEYYFESYATQRMCKILTQLEREGTVFQRE